MSQGELFDLAPAAAPSDRIFFAIAPDAGAVARIGALNAALAAAHGLRSRPTADSKLHCTLCNLGDHVGLPQALIARASAAAASVAAATGPFDASFDTVQSFATRARQQPLVLTGNDGVIGISALHQRLAVALIQAGIGGNRASHTPHITLRYDDTRLPPQAIAPIGWRVSELLLLHSHIGQGRPYTILARWPL